MSAARRKPVAKVTPPKTRTRSRPTPIQPQPEPREPRWQLTWGDHVWTEDDLTGAHLAVIVMIHKDDQWRLVSPLGGPVRLMAVLSAFIAIADDRAFTEVNDELSRCNAATLLGALSIV